MAKQFFEFQHSTKVISGENALEVLAFELNQMEAKRPLVLSDQGLSKLGITRKATDAMASGGCPAAALFTDIPADSSLDKVNEIARYYKSMDCDSLVAVGGGSVIDTAKGVRMILSQEVSDILSLAGCENLKLGKRIPFAVIPTTSGTGSEATLVAVIRDELRGMKMEFISYFLQPDMCILDPVMTLSLPPRITAATGMDALCHAIEAYSCLQKNPVSDAYAFTAIKMIRENLMQAVNNGKNKQARIAMANASMMAGAAFSNSMVGLIHAVGHALGGVCRVPHGEAMNILLPYGMMYNYHRCKKEYAELLLPLAGPEVYAQTPAQDRAKESIRMVMRMKKALYQSSGLPMKLNQAGVQEKDFEEIAQVALDDGASIVNPVAADVEDIIKLLKKAY